MKRDITNDLTTGTQTSRVYVDGGVFGPVGQFRIDETGTELGSISDRRYEIRPDDPLSARASMNQECLFQRGDWSVRIEARSEMTATATDFRLHATVACWDGDRPFHSVTWDHSIPRNGM